MTIPDKIQCPICKNMMSDLTEENPTLGRGVF